MRAPSRASCWTTYSATATRSRPLRSDGSGRERDGHDPRSARPQPDGGLAVCARRPARAAGLRTAPPRLARARSDLMVQVENETGMIPEARDHSPTADSLYARAVPRELLDYVQRHRDSLAPE